MQETRNILEEAHSRPLRWQEGPQPGLEWVARSPLRRQPGAVGGDTTSPVVMFPNIQVLWVPVDWNPAGEPTRATFPMVALAPEGGEALVTPCWAGPHRNGALGPKQVEMRLRFFQVPLFWVQPNPVVGNPPQEGHSKVHSPRQRPQQVLRPW